MIRKPFRMRGLILLVIVGAIVSYVAGWWTFDLSNPDGSGVRLSIESRDIVSSGEEMTVAFVLDNNERSSLTNLELTIQWPEGVRIINTSIPAINSSQNSWDWDELAVGDSNRLEVTLQLFGEEKDIKQINATLVYQLTNFSSDFFADSVHDVHIGDSVIQVKFDEVDDIPPLTETDWRVVITAQELVSENNFFRLILPSGLEVNKIQPDDLEVTKQGDKQFIDYSLEGSESGDTVIIKLTGKFEAGNKGKEIFTWQFGELTTEEFAVVQEGEFEQFVIGDEAELEVLVNGEESPEAVNWGDIVEVTLAVRNITSEDLKNLEWSLTLTPDVINWSAVSSDANLVNESDGVVRLLPESNESMKILAAGEESNIKISIPIKSIQTNTGVIVGTARLRILGESGVDALSFTKTIGPINLAQSVRWHTTAHYFSDEGVQVGSGPLPPVVGERTTYRIQWNLAGAESGAQSTTFSTTLPSYVSWNNQFSANRGNISYDAARRLVTWTINNLDSYNFSNGELQAEWEVGFIPNSGHAGRIIPLTQITNLELTNSSNNTKSQSQPGLTTNLEGDVYASGKGVVRED